MHVRDVAQFIDVILHGRLRGVFNVGGHNRRKVELVEALRELVPDLEVEFKEGKQDPRDYRVGFERAKQLGFEPEFTPEDGLASIVAAVQRGFFVDVHSGRYRNA